MLTRKKKEEEEKKSTLKFYWLRPPVRLHIGTLVKLQDYMCKSEDLDPMLSCTNWPGLRHSYMP